MHGKGTCMAGGGMCGRGVYMEGGHAWQSVCAGETVSEAGGKHPTGMHSCI